MSVERFPVEAGHVLTFARAIGDDNPVYRDPDSAAASEAGGLIAPPTFTIASAQWDPDYPLRPKPGVTGSRVFIGEYGFAARTYPEAERDRKSREIMRIGFEHGCPFILCWQMYNNEYSDGAENGYWLINDKGRKVPLWHTHYDFYARARQFRRERSSGPTREEFRRFALSSLPVDGNKR